MKNKFLILLVLLLAEALSPPEVIAAPTYLGGGTSAGNGGDILNAFLESTRKALINTLLLLKDSPVIQQSLCNQEPLSASQREECRFFILQGLDQMLGLNLSRKNPTPFTVTSEPLLVDGVDGKPRPVDARTQLGANGPIEFNYVNVRYFSPVQLLILMTHEFGHKVIVRGAPIQDNVPTDAFPSGRDLLDTVGAAIAELAQKQEFVRDVFLLNDHFECSAEVDGNTLLYPGVSSRYFSKRGSFDSFEVTIGKRAKDLPVRFKRSGMPYVIEFQAEFHEENGCRKNATIDQRWTRVQLIKSFMKGQENGGDEMVQEEFFRGFNPLCETSRRTIAISYEDVTFSCTYVGSYADQKLRGE